MTSKYRQIVEYLRTFEQHLDNDHEIALRFAQYGGPFPLLVTRSGGEDFILFELATHDNDTFAIVQNYSHLNFAIVSLPKKTHDKPARRVGFLSYP